MSGKPLIQYTQPFSPRPDPQYRPVLVLFHRDVSALSELLPACLPSTPPLLRCASHSQAQVRKLLLDIATY